MPDLIRLREKHRQRNQAKKSLKNLLSFKSLLCYWCFTPVQSIKALDKNCIIQFNNHKVRYVDERNRVIEKSVATIDHVVELERNGQNVSENVVISCADCNSRRSSPHRSRFFHFQNREQIRCRKCGKYIGYIQASDCSDCIEPKIGANVGMLVVKALKRRVKPLHDETDLLYNTH